MYHEKQNDLFCGQHALNNLFQEEKFYSDDNNINTLINSDGKFNLKGFCYFLNKYNLIAGEKCSSYNGNYILEAIWCY